MVSGINLPLIPARSGSKGIISKNTQPIGGIPLFIRSIVHSTRLSHSTKPIISSDSIDYLKIAQNFFPNSKAEIEVASDLVEFKDFFFHKRPANLSGDSSLIGDLLCEISKNLRERWNWPLFEEVNLITILQPTTPFRSTLELVHEVPSKFRMLIEQQKCLVSLTAIGEVHPARMYQLDVEGISKNIGLFPNEERMPRQNLSKLFIRDGAFYVLPLNTAKKGLPFEDHFLGYVRDSKWSTNIDDSTQLDLANYFFNKGYIQGDPNEDYR